MNSLEIKRRMLLMGLIPKHKGFYYISSAIILMEKSGGDDPVRSYRRAFSSLPDGRKQAERCMRYAICYAWDVTRGDIRELFPLYDCPPTPMEFILTFWLALAAEGGN